MLDLFFIIILLLVGFYWSSAMKAREVAFMAANVYCQKMDVYLLDEYVALNGQWFKRDEGGKALVSGEKPDTIIIHGFQSDEYSIPNIPLVLQYESPLPEDKKDFKIIRYT